MLRRIERPEVQHLPRLKRGKSHFSVPLSLSLGLLSLFCPRLDPFVDPFHVDPHESFKPRDAARGPEQEATRLNVDRGHVEERGGHL